MLCQGGGDLLKGRQAGAADSLAPAVQKLAGPSGRKVSPVMLEGGHQPESADRGQARSLQLPHAFTFLAGPVLSVLEQSPAEFLQLRLESSFGQSPSFGFAHVVHCFIELLADVET